MEDLTPLPNESQPEFAERFHSEMSQRIPETDARTRECFRLWDKYRAMADPLRNKANSTFRNDEFDIHQNVPVFTEHTTRDRAGNMVIYDRRALAAILDRCNHRISDTGNFAPLIEGHTPDRESQAAGASMPPVLGYAGPYRLGMIGNENPRWAIFADEYHHKEDADKLRKLRRRSPEVWLEERMEDRFFDPIACLGAETPRLDMGMTRFCLTASGRAVEKYSAAFPSATNVFVPQQGDDDKQSYSGEATMALSPEDLNQIVDAMMQTEPMQWAISQMGSEGAAPESVAPDGLGEGGLDAAPPEALPAPDMPGGEPAPMGEPAPEPMGDPMGGAPMDDAQMTAPEDDEMQPYSCDDEDYDQMQAYMAGDITDDEMMEYAAGKRRKRRPGARKKSYMADGSVDDSDTHPKGEGDIEPDQKNYSRDRRAQARYSRLEAKVRRLEAHNRNLQSQQKRIELDRERADRAATLTDLSRYHRMDEEKEIERCDPERMSREIYEDHLEAIKTNYEKLPVGIPMVYAPDLPHEARDQDKYSKETVDKAKAYVLSERNAGRDCDWRSALEHVATA